MENNNPKISVILTSYNHAKYIGEAIESVLNQGFKDFELIIIDDKSSDNSLEIVQKYQDQRIKFIANEINLGMCGALNLGISQAKGKYIAHICSDDKFTNSSKLQKQFDFLEDPKNSSYGAVFTLANPITENGTALTDKSNPHYCIFDRAKNKSREGWLKFFFYDFNCLCFPSILVKKECYDLVGNFDSRYSMMLDLDMWIRIALEYNIYVIQEKLIDFRVGEASTSSQDNARVIANFESTKLLYHFLRIDNIDFLYRVLGLEKDSLFAKFGEKSDAVEICNFLVLKKSSELQDDVHQRFFLDAFFEKMADKKFIELLKSLDLNQVFFHKNRNSFLQKFIKKSEAICKKQDCGLSVREVPHFKALFNKKTFLQKLLNPLEEIKRHLIKKQILKYENLHKTNNL